MPFKRLFFVLCLIATLGLVAAGCGDDDDSSESSEETASVSPEDCTPDQLETVAPDTLTIATDDPAFPPYFEDNDPTNGEGFESAVAYAVAEELGFTEDQVEWVVEPFNRSYAPGPKDYDFDINQISITEKRAEAVDFSSPYYEAKQAVVALKDSSIADATSLADVADADIGAQIGTTSLDAIETVIQPSSPPQVFDTSTAAHFVDRGLIKPPMLIQSVFGIRGGIGAHPEDVIHMKRTADRLFGDAYYWSVLGAGRNQMAVAAQAAVMGGNVRVGLEDSLWLGRGQLAKSNAEQVAKAKRMLEELGLSVATANDAREMLKLKGGRNVAF